MSNSDFSAPEQRIILLQSTITSEIFKALGLGKASIFRRPIARVLGPVTLRFARIAERYVRESVELGVAASARRTLPEFSMSAESCGKDHIPAAGPVLLAVNHPGALDSLALMSCMPRSDVRILVSDSPFMREFAAGSPFFIFVDFKTIGGMAALREAIAHLQAGGLVSLFAHGEVEPDPELDAAGALSAIPEWSRSIEVMLRKMPETQLVLAVMSGAVMRRFMRSPLVWLRKKRFEKQKLAEFIQVIKLLIAPRTLQIKMHLSFAGPLVPRALGDEKIMPVIESLETRLMQEHINRYAG